MAADIAQDAMLRKMQFHGDGMALACALRNYAAMSRTGMQRARQRLGLTQPDIAERLGVSVPQVSRWETGKNAIPSSRFAALAQAYETPMAELLAEDAAARTTNAQVVRYEGASDVTLPRDVPIFGTSLGAPQDFDGHAIEQTTLNTAEIIGHLPRPTVLNGQQAVYGLYVQGSSMAPRHEDGDTIFAQDSRQGRPPRIGDDVVIYLRDEDDEEGERARAVLIKRLLRRNSDFVELEQFTPAHVFRLDAAAVLRIDRVIPWRELLS